MMGSRARQLLMGVRCAVRVELERDALLPGETLAGVVVLDVGKPMDAAVLKVRVRGRQTLHWTTSSGDAMVAHAQTKEHLFDETVLADENTALGVGQWRYPFAFELPEDVQHDFEHKCSRVQELEGVRVSVHHEVEATLDLRGVAILNLNDKRVFRVNALPVAVPFGRRVGVAREDTVNFLALFQRGSCHVRMDLDTDVFDTTSTIKALVTLDMKTSKALKHVVLLLYEDVYVDCHNPLFPGRKQGSRSVRFRRFDRAEIESAETEGMVTRLHMELPISAEGSTRKETALNPTMSSIFINVRYRVAVEVKFSMAPRIRVHAPVTILPRLVAPHELEITPVVTLPVAEPIP